MGNSALCRPVIEPMLPKSQYKMSMFFPVPETESAHVIGESTMKWGEWRTIPGAGEDALYICGAGKTAVTREVNHMKPTLLPEFWRVFYQSLWRACPYMVWPLMCSANPA